MRLTIQIPAECQHLMRDFAQATGRAPADIAAAFVADVLIDDAEAHASNVAAKVIEWTALDDKNLRAYRAAGCAPREIAAAMGLRVSDVRARLRELGVK